MSHRRENKARRSHGLIKRLDDISHDRRKRKDSRKEFLFETRARQSRQVRRNFWILLPSNIYLGRKTGTFYERNRRVRGFCREVAAHFRHTGDIYLWRGYCNISPQDYLSVCEKFVAYFTGQSTSRHISQNVASASDLKEAEKLNNL